MAGELDAADVFDLGTWLGHLEADTYVEKPTWSDIKGWRAPCQQQK